MFNLARNYLRRRYEEGFKEGFEESYRKTYLKSLQEGRLQWDEEAVVWNERRLEAERRGKKFREHSPGFKQALRRTLAKRRCPCCQEMHHDF